MKNNPYLNLLSLTVALILSTIVAVKMYYGLGIIMSVNAPHYAIGLIMVFPVAFTVFIAFVVVRWILLKILDLAEYFAQKEIDRWNKNN